MIKKLQFLLGNKIILYQVGGSVRDELMGCQSNDYDFATPNIPDEVEEAILSIGRKPHIVGKRFGTIGISIDGQIIEITTFRTEKYQKKNRKPQVEFVKDLKEDLSRRDFTINAIAKDFNGNYIDPFGGRLDILEGRIKCVMKPKDRFIEDPLRMLRAIRFASQFNFSIEQNTYNYIEKMSDSILNISKERWVMELDKIMETKDAVRGLVLVMDTGLLKYMIPELSLQKNYNQNSPYHRYDLWTHTLLTVAHCDEIDLRWAALLHDIAKPFVVKLNKKGYNNYIHHEELGYEMVIKLGNYLHWSKKRIEFISEVVLTHLDPLNPLYYADNKSKQPIGGD